MVKIDAINRVTLSSKLANSKIQFKTYDDYEQMQDLIDSCARLRIVPVGWMEVWADMQDDAVECHKFIKRVVSDWDYINDKCQISETDETYCGQAVKWE